MPSWRCHKLVGEIICLGYYDHEIDRLIDAGGRHDLARYDEGELIREAMMVLRRFGGNGLCYYILHHVLDRLQDILVSELAQNFVLFKDGRDVNYVYELMRRSVLKRIVRDDRTVISWALRSDSKSREHDIVKAMTTFVIKGVEFSIDCVLLYLMIDLDGSGRPTTGSRAHTAIVNKILAEGYRLSSSPTWASEYASEHESLILRYLSEIVGPAKKQCLELRNDRRRAKEVEAQIGEVLRTLARHGVTIYVYES